MKFPPIFVAEVKTQSPFGFRSTHSRDALVRLAVRFGDMISIHTDERWGGSFGVLNDVRMGHLNKPILAKGIHAKDDDIQRALDCGADRVLVVGRIPADKYLDKIWYEPNTIKEMLAAPDGLKLVWNDRDLRTGDRKTIGGIRNTWFDANIPEHAKLRKRWVCQASFIKHPDDIENGVSAFIVGEHLVDFVNARW